MKTSTIAIVVLAGVLLLLVIHIVAVVLQYGDYKMKTIRETQQQQQDRIEQKIDFLLEK